MTDWSAWIVCGIKAVLDGGLRLHSIVLVWMTQNSMSCYSLLGGRFVTLLNAICLVCSWTPTTTTQTRHGFVTNDCTYLCVSLLHSPTNFLSRLSVISVFIFIVLSTFFSLLINEPFWRKRSLTYICVIYLFIFFFLSVRFCEISLKHQAHGDQRREFRFG